MDYNLKTTFEEEKFYLRSDIKAFENIYYNPDSNAGGQFVVNYFSYELVCKALKHTNTIKSFFEYIDERAYVELIDLGTPQYDDFLNDLKDCPAPICIGRNKETMDILVSISERSK